MTVLRWGAGTDIGMVRETNQDAFLVDEPLFAVADGMGGHAGGEVASATAIEILQETFSLEHSTENLLDAVRRANAKVWDKGQLDDKLHNMGTTLTVVAKLTDDTSERLALVNVGDSRGYLFRNDELVQITTDHSLVEEMMAAGEITAEEAETHPRRNILTRALGVEPTVEADLIEIDPQVGDRVLLCSDGLVREVTDDRVAATLRRLKNPDEAVRELITLAKAAGGHDNITVVIVDVEDDPVLHSSSTSSESARDAKPSKANVPSLRPASARFTVRTLAFFATVIGLVVIAVGSVWWYARAPFYVGLDGQSLAVYRGRPEPVLWFEPTLAERTSVMLTDVLPNENARLQVGTVVTSRDAAHDYIRNLVQEAANARGTQPATPLYQDATVLTTAAPTTEAPATTAAPTTPTP